MQQVKIFDNVINFAPTGSPSQTCVRVPVKRVWEWSVVLWPTCGSVYATWALCRGQLANLFFSVARRSRSDVSEWVSDSSFRDFTDVTLVSDDTDKDDEDNEDDEDDEVDEADEDD